jgi:uncharacterized protein YjbI with pentapeptide repeats
MTDQTGIEWPTCDEDGCIGVRLAATPKCLAHTRDEQRNATLKQLGETGEIDARGASITQALLEQILAAAPRDAKDHRTFKAARFDRVTFQSFAEFGLTTFQDGSYFGGATFQDGAWFGRAVFKGLADFRGATFQGLTEFTLAAFGEAWFNGARFEQARQLGPLLVYDLLRLDGAYFAQLIQIEASSRGLSCQRARFPAGVQFRLRGPQIVLDDADLSGPSILMGITALSGHRWDWRLQEVALGVTHVTPMAEEVALALRPLLPQAEVELLARPRLLSVQGANVAGLTVSNVDLAECRFAGAHNLDRLRLESEVTFSPAPVRLPWDWRQVIAEERAWRAAPSKRQTPRWRAARSNRWATPQSPPAWLHRPYGKEWPGVLPAGQIAGLYRALRKGREDAKDEPGAADFYYGEMEMRRHASRSTDISIHNRTGEVSGGEVERAILTVYWLVSGYGLRAWRALAWLAAVTAVFAV